MGIDKEDTDQNKKHMGREDFSPIVGWAQRHTCTIIQACLREAVGAEGLPVFVHVPFITLGLLNWKPSVGSYGENPEGMYELLETVLLTHNPNGEKRVVLGEVEKEGSGGGVGLGSKRAPPSA